MKTKPLLLLCLVAVLMLSGCADKVSFEYAKHIAPVGFWRGLWHGMIAPVAFIWSWFDDYVTVYAIYNNGNWYNFGFLIGVGALFGGGSSSTKSK